MRRHGSAVGNLSCLLIILFLASEVSCIRSYKVREQPTASVSREEERPMSTVPPQYVDKTTAQRELESYVLGGRYGRRTVPTLLNPADVEDFIRRKLDRGRPVTAFRRSRFAVDYYDLRSVLDHFEKMLRRSEKDSKEFGQSIEIISVLSAVGGEPQTRKAAEYFEYLVNHQLAPESYEQLIEAVEVMGPGVNSKSLANRMDASLKALQPKAASDAESDNEYQRIDQWLNNDLPRVEADGQYRQQVLALPTTQERVEQLCRIYLGWGEVDSIELSWWSARWLRNEARANRTDLIIAMLRKTLEEIETSDLPREEKEPYIVRAARAIKFFGVALLPREQRILDRAKTSQFDVLDRE